MNDLASASSAFQVSDREPGRLGAELTSFAVQELDARATEELVALLYRRKLLVLRDQHLDEQELIAFAARLGRIRPYFQEHYHHPQHPEIFVSGNVPMDGRKVGVSGTGRMWHSDYAFFPDPLSFTLITPRVLPAGERATCFVDMVAMGRALPDELRGTLAGRRCFHDATSYYKVQPGDVDKAIVELVEEFHAVAPRSWHPAFLTHPVTGDESVFVSSGFTTAIEGLPHEESRATLERLFAFVERAEHVHVEPHAVGTILLWDNRSVIHRAQAAPGGEPSLGYRISVDDGRPFFGAAAAAQSSGSPR